MEKRELLDFLTKHGIPFWQWGTGKSKTVEHLLFEINSGETVLYEEENGNVVRSASGAALNIYHQDGKRILKLEEEKQVFRDGRERRRNLETSIGEKMKNGETPEGAAYRALKEELGISEKLALEAGPAIVKGPVTSESFPGLKTIYIIFIYDCFLPDHFYKSEGYREEQKDKTSYFVWKDV